MTAPTRLSFDTAAASLSADPGEGLAQTAESGLIAACRPQVLRKLLPPEQRAADRFATAFAVAVCAAEASDALLDRLRAQASHTALMLSGGGKLGNYHIGVARALLAQGLLPRIISGSSAGAFIGALLTTRTDAELTKLLAGDGPELATLSLDGAIEAASVAFSQPGLRRFLDRLIPDLTLVEARAVSGRSLHIVVGENAGGGRVLNADLTPDVLIRDAVVASCAIPFVYPSVQIAERHADGSKGFLSEGREFIDGSIHADLPSAWLREHCGVTLLVASVVNPYELPFLTDPDHHGPAIHAATTMGMGMIRNAMSAGVGMALPFFQAMPDGARALSIWKRVLDQRIEADVIIAPGQRMHDPIGLTERVTGAQLMNFIAEGEAAAGAKLSLLSPSLRIERALALARAG